MPARRSSSQVGSAAGRPARSDRPIRSRRAARCPASRTSRCRRSRRAARRAGSARSRRRVRSRKRTVTAPAREPQRSRWPRRPPRPRCGRRRCARSSRAAAPPRAHGCRACRSCMPSRSATWSEPITTAPGCRRATARALARARRSASAAGGSPGCAVSSTSGDSHVERQPQARQQFAPVARGRSRGSAAGAGHGAIVPSAVVRMRVRRTLARCVRGLRPDAPRRAGVRRRPGRSGGALAAGDSSACATAARRSAAERPATRCVWRARGEQRAAARRTPQTWLHLSGRRRPVAGVPALPAAGRGAAASRSPVPLRQGRGRGRAVDAEQRGRRAGVDALAGPARLIEDELLLALPLVPRHEECPHPLPCRLGDGTARPGRAPSRRWPRSSAGQAELGARRIQAGRSRPTAQVDGARAHVARMLESSAFRAAHSSPAVLPRAADGVRRHGPRRLTGMRRQQASGEFHGRPAEQEIALQARHAPLAQRAGSARHRRSSRPPAKCTCATTSARPASTAAARS